MDRRDRIVVFAGVLILVLALIGVIFTGDETSDAEEIAELQMFNINWQEKTVDIREEGAVMKGNTESLNFSIDKKGLMHIAFTLEWSDDRARGFIIPWNWSDTLMMSVSAPSGVQFSGMSSDEGTASPLTVEASINTIPSSMQVNASNMASVQEMIEENYMDNTGTGIWNTRINIATKPFLLDRGNDFTIVLRYSHFEPVITEIN